MTINNFQEQFYQMMTRLKANSRAASTQDARITEITNGLLVSKQTKKEPEVIDLQEYAKSGKSASVSGFGINKVKEIADFMNARNY